MAYELPFAVDLIMTVSIALPVELKSTALSPALSANGAYRPPFSSPAHQTTILELAPSFVPCGNTYLIPAVMSSLRP